MKITPKNILKVLLFVLVMVLQEIRLSFFSYIALFLLKWPAPINVIIVVLLFFSSFRYKSHKIDKFFKIFSYINIPLNIGIWVVALISFINGTINCNPIVFYVLFGINAFLTITKIPKMFKDEEDEKTQTEPVKNK